MGLETVKEKALEKYYPEEEELEGSRELFREVEEFIQEEYGLESHFAGSASRGTCLKGDKDIDVFVKFPEDTERRELEEKGLEIGKKFFESRDAEYHVEYAEHPYTKGEIRGREVEIVPCIDTDPENISSSVDRTPHHTGWVKENLNSRQRKDVVALKAFLKAQGLYGSSLKVRGFSGYLCETLIACYGSFEDLISEASQWEEDQRIDFDDSDEEFDSSLTVVDPVDPERNVAAVLSKENYSKFVFQAYRLSKNPSIEFFEIDDSFNEFELKKEVDRRADILVVVFESPDRVEDIIYPQLRKMKRLISGKLEKHDFRIFSEGEHVTEEKCRIYFELERHLPENQVVKGPKVFHNQKHLDQFTSKYEKGFVEEERVCAKIDREFEDAQNLIKSILSGDASKLKEKGVPNHLAPEVEEFRFADPMDGEEKWLKYLYKEFNL
jgi:tRNA nucleotidyltransferase (CCA-adding enzyme)